MYSEEHVENLFVNRTSVMSQKIGRVSFGFNDVFRDGSVVRYDGEANGGTGGFELASIGESQWEDVARRIPGLLRATTVEPGYYEVVTSPSAAGLIAHEAFGHGVETDMFLKGRAKSREYLGKPVGSGLVNLFDDPTYPGGFGTYGFDDEGQPASKTQILRNGVFIQGLTDLNATMRLGIHRTSNGRRQDVNKAYPRMTNTYFGTGEDRLEDMISGIDHGIYLGPTESGMEDPKDWGVQCILGWGRVIERGKLTDRYHSEVGLTGYVPDLLGSIDMVGRDIKLYGGHCGKGYKEMVRVGMGGPHLRMKARLG
jgi:TldD protein